MWVLTVSGLAEVLAGGVARLGGAGLVDRLHAELVDFTLGQVWHLTLRAGTLKTQVQVNILPL